MASSTEPWALGSRIRKWDDALSTWAAPGASRDQPANAVFAWLVRLRWLAIAGVTLVLVGTNALRVLPRESAWELWSIVSGLSAYNAALGSTRFRRALGGLSAFASQLVVDCLALGLLVHFAGGVENPFLSLFMLHVVNANILLRRRAASALHLMALGLGSAIVLGEGAGLVAHHCLRQNGEACIGSTLNPWALGTLAGLGLMLVASSHFARYVTGQLHQSERRLAGTVEDLSRERDRLREAREDVETERSRLKAIIDCMGDAVSFSDRAGNVLLENQRAAELWSAPGGSNETRAAVLNAALASATGEHVFERAGRSYETTTSVVRDQRERAMGLVMVAHDVTDRLALERRLMHEEQMSVVGKLAAVVAHEINNPIGVVSLYAQHALARLPKGDPLERHLETIRRNAESCRKITGDLLELARPRKPAYERVDLRMVCQDVAQSVEPLAAKLGVRVTCERNGSAIWTEADAQQLRQALLNLALNAVEASREGGSVRLRAFEAPELEPTTRAVEVSDCGEGIPAAELERIFQPFFTTKPTGTGLGLAVADNIVRGHGGRISVESEERRGTTMRVLLPEVASKRALASLGGNP